MPPEVVEAFVEKIVSSNDGFEWYLRFDGDPKIRSNARLTANATKKRRSTSQEILSLRYIEATQVAIAEMKKAY